MEFFSETERKSVDDKTHQRLYRHKLFEENDDMERKTKDESGRIIINVGGQRHETYLTTLRNYPDTRLFWITEQHNSTTKSPEYNADKNEYFFDRHPGVFSNIVNYYRTGKLHCPLDVCGPLFEEELSFWGIDEGQVELCCWENYKQHKEKQEKLKYFATLEESVQSDETDDDLYGTWENIKKKGLELLEKPSSSLVAKIITIISLITFLVMVVQFCLASLKTFRYNEKRKNILSAIRIFSATWFTLELSLRCVFSTSLLAHFKKILNLLDLMSVCALIIHAKIHYNSGDNDISPFEMIMFLKALRLSKLLTFSFVIEVLANTLKASSRELCLLTIIVLFQAFAFSSALFFIERDNVNSKFESVPHSLWWAIITMTTVGYGDIKPTTWGGQILGCGCALCGVLVIALPVSVVATNFSIFYTYAKARLNLPPKAHKKLPLPKELTSMKAKKDDLGFSLVNYSCTSLHKPRQSVEATSPDGLHRPTYDTSVDNQPETYDSAHNSPVGKNTPTAIFTPSFQEVTFDFLDVPKHKLNKSFLSNSFSRVFGSKNHLNKTQETQLMLDVHSNYPLYSRRGAVAPGSITSRSISSTIYGSTTSNIPYCVRRSMDIMRHKHRLKRAGKWNNTRKCLSNAELHLVCFHHCNTTNNNDNLISDGTSDGTKLTTQSEQASKSSMSVDECTCKPDLTSLNKSRLAKSCSELNDILQNTFVNNYLHRGGGGYMTSSGELTSPPSMPQISDNVQFGNVAITINGCSEEGLVSKTNVANTTCNHKDKYLKPQTTFM